MFGRVEPGELTVLVGSQAVPVVIVAPLLIVWFGFGIAPKLAIIALVCFFPVVVTTLDALAAVDPEQRKLLRTLEEKQHSVSGARNFALICTYLLTGYRNREVVRMQWKHIRPSRVQKDVVVYAWQGKGGKKAEEPIPEDAWYAIVHYLKLDGRWIPGVEPQDQPLNPDEDIVKPTTNHTLQHLKNVRVERRTENEPLRRDLKVTRHGRAGHRSRRQDPPPMT